MKLLCGEEGIEISPYFMLHLRLGSRVRFAFATFALSRLRRFAFVSGKARHRRRLALTDNSS